MSKTVKLHPVEPVSASEKTRAQAIELLKEALAEAERGDITEILLIIKRPGDDRWDNRSTGTNFASSWIGRLEITKHQWIQEYTAD